MGSATATPSTNQPMLQAALSRKLGSRPGARKSRSTSRSATTTATRTTSVMPSGYEKGDAEHEVDRQQLHSLVPRRLTLVGDVVGDQDRQQDPAELEAVEYERHRMRAEDEAHE